MAIDTPEGLPPAPFLYPIIDTGACAARGRDPLAVAAAYFAGGVRLVQLRCKREGSAAFLDLARRLVGAAGAHGARVIINDRADIAALSGAAGVHVGQADLPLAEARAVAGPAAIVGISTHDERQVDEALAAGPSYVAVGPIFGTRTKETGYEAVGTGLIRYAAGRGCPIVAIGGITAGRAAGVVEAGAAGLAVITDLLDGGGPEARVPMFAEALRAAPRGAAGP